METVLDVIARATATSLETLRAECEVRDATYLASDLRVAFEHPVPVRGWLLTVSVDSKKSSSSATGGATPGDAGCGEQRVSAHAAMSASTANRPAQKWTICAHSRDGHMHGG
jgi:hypothetical protein